MGLFALINVVLVAIGIALPGWIGLWAILLTSFFMSLMFPTIFALGIKDLGEHTKEGASLLVMAIIGGAVFTPLDRFCFSSSQHGCRHVDPIMLLSRGVSLCFLGMPIRAGSFL